jgi:hypothetical protein
VCSAEPLAAKAASLLEKETSAMKFFDDLVKRPISPPLVGGD